MSTAYLLGTNYLHMQNCLDQYSEDLHDSPTEVDADLDEFDDEVNWSDAESWTQASVTDMTVDESEDEFDVKNELHVMWVEEPLDDEANVAVDDKKKFGENEFDIQVPINVPPEESGFVTLDEHTGEAGLLAKNCPTLKDNLWIADTGATSHMTPSKECIVNVKPVKKNIGNKTVAKATWQGDLPVTVYRQSGMSRDGLLKNVLVVPDLGFNLFSLTKAVDKNGFTLLGDKDGCDCLRTIL